MSSQSSIQGQDERLHAFFDDELEDSERALVQAEIERDADLAGEIDDISFMREIVIGALERQAERVPEARFEQLWDNFEATLERESRLQEAAEAPPRPWQRLFSWLRPARLPLAAVATAGLLAIIFARSVGDPAPELADGAEVAEPGAEAGEKPANTPKRPASERPAAGASKGEPPRIAAVPPPKPAPGDPQAPEMNFPQPEPGEAEIRHIEFGGRSGSISQVEGARGTTTVIWVSEDDPVDSERSL
ncbi:hypothetical protein G6O69_30175 [Pseudenhygromyxa sp. WMMC2535]|uniref:hypothetical protein n=1 Tax=Pseudenhygromyxa sp. WMMC2535 TaxID=2712867 RepID=UPI001555D60E|nr:hypothetical protein [Pseudenhygromyxa sp. WMMC2535]NVB42129.1 hypothetical protein [Pseudenhygromyxa sp. WMMC2535]